jgi:cell division septum initiation protein DivIVA
MSIQKDVIEIQELDKEMKRLRKRLKHLSSQKNKCEERILEYLRVNEQPGLRMNGTVIMATDIKKRKKRKKADKIRQGETVLEKYGIPNAKDALDEILESMRGSPEHSSKLKIY